MAQTIRNIDNIVEEVSIKEGVSKLGNAYSVLMIKLTNGINIEYMPEKPYQEIIQMLLKDNK
jgi:hypothetical protein